MAQTEKPRRCGNCGNEVSAAARYCSQCGERQGDLEPRAGTGLLPANRRLHGDRYLIVRKLAQGGQSAVYLAMDTASGQRCAIKELSESQLSTEERLKAVNDFLREANILMRLSHPGLCRVYDTFLEGSRKPFLVMEYVEGHNLEDELIQAGRPLEWQRVVTWGLMLADVLGYLHKQNPPIIYRDLKPANVMLLPNGNIKLIDFGIARQLYLGRLRDTARLGTDGYAPLEQYSAHSEPRSDLYALGASLYHLLTGRVPETAPLRYAGHPLTPIRAVNPTVPEPLDRVIQQALRLDSHDRFPDAFALRHALEWASRVSAPNAAGWRAQGNLPHNIPNPGMPGMAAPGMAPGMPRGQTPLANGQTHPSQATAGPVSRVPAGAANTPDGLSQTGPTPAVAPVKTTTGEQRAVILDGGASWPGRIGADSRTTANGQPVAPRLRLWPLRLDVGLLEANQASVQPLEISNRGGGQLVGVTETNNGCLSVEPARIDADTTRLQVRVNTAGMAPGEYRYLVAVRTNGGDQIVPVSFMVRPAGNVPAGGWGQRRQ